MYVDNVLYFKHIRFPNEIIYMPKYIVTITNVLLNKSYVYGCYTLPSDQELLECILPKRTWENENYIPTEYRKTDYIIKIN